MVMHNARTENDNARSHSMPDLSALRDIRAVSQKLQLKEDLGLQILMP